MKPLFYFLILSSFVLTSCQDMADEDDYNNLANDLCDCVNKSNSSVSNDMKNALIQGINSGQSMDDVMAKMGEENVIQTMKDAEVLMDAGPKIETCVKSLEKKYDKIYTKESDKEVLNRLMKTLEKNKSCDWTYALMKLGMQVQ